MLKVELTYANTLVDFCTLPQAAWTLLSGDNSVGMFLLCFGSLT